MEQLTKAKACLKKAKELLKEMSQSLPPVEQGDSKAPPTQKSLPLIINLDLIAELRQQKRYSEADKLIKIYHRKLRNVRKREQSQIIDENIVEKENKLLREHERFLKKLYHICVRISCTNDAEEGKNYCQQCRNKRAEWRKKQ
mgnify:CR=1 FL=1